MHLGFCFRIALVMEDLLMLLRHFALNLDVWTVWASIVGLFQVLKQIVLSFASE